MRVITESNATELKRLEKVIEKGLGTCVEVAAALKQIKEGQLYLASHKSFEEYCNDRWDFGRHYANKLIQAGEVVGRLREVIASGDNCHHELPSLPSKESQVRELAKAPPEQQAEVWKEVTEKTTKPTAKDVKAAVERRKQVVQGEIVDDDEEIPFAKPSDAPPMVDQAAERAKKMVPELCRSIAFQLGNLGANGRFDQYLDEIREFAR